MHSKSKYFVAAAAVAALLPAAAAAQQAQIPSLQVCNQTRVQGSGIVKIASRSDILHSGSFVLRIEVACDPAAGGVPVGAALFRNIDMSDSVVQGDIDVVSIDQLTSSGKHSPTAWLTGRCRAADVNGCRYWLMIADNGKGGHDTPDVVGFLVFDADGKRIAYGTGPVADGDYDVSPTSN